MAGVSLQSVEKTFGDTRVIHGIDIEIEEGTFVILVGPSGCGTCTLRRIIAGLEDVIIQHARPRFCVEVITPLNRC